MLMDFDVVVNYKELTDYNLDESVSGSNEGVGYTLAIVPQLFVVQV